MQTKTVAQCVEFYYTYKKQVKIGRNGTLTFGPPDSPVDKSADAVVDIKVSQLHCVIKQLLVDCVCVITAHASQLPASLL